MLPGLARVELKNFMLVHKVAMEADFDVQCRCVVGDIVRQIDRVCRNTVLSSEKSKKRRFKVYRKFTKTEREMRYLGGCLNHVV